MTGHSEPRVGTETSAAAGTSATEASGCPGVLVTLLLASTLGVMAGSVISPVVEVIRGDFGVSGTAAGLVVTAHALAVAVTSPLIGRAIDHCGVRIPLAAGLVLYGISGGAGLFTTSYPALIASRLVFGIGAAAVFTGTTVALLQLFTGPRRDRVMGWRSAANSVGGLVWPLLGGTLGGLSWHAPFAIYLVGLPLGVAAVLALPHTAPHRAARTRGGVLALVRQSPAVLGFYALQAAASIFLYTMVVFLPQRLADLGIREPLMVSLYLVVMTGAISSLVGLVYAPLRARLSYAALLRTAALAWAGAFTVLGTVDHPVLLLAGPALLGLGQGLSLPSLTVLVNESAPPALRGQATSLAGTVIFGGQFLSPLLLGPLIGATSSTVGFLTAAVMAGLIALTLTTVRMASSTSPGGSASASDN
ncbi:MFS transporter [Saccharopolyspora mangrovi]|uniref:MFS transporter n=1 Tax=Saccharopolyspora mangrovi TaxID=3082379 RepID=A0ABU6AJB4_9PSEU|nr:MFS transporter [Saccharopolyspora sp. S2-29]MEB3371552.1 MFS transporter [Saccharopolyspora sp. S2-29]